METRGRPGKGRHGENGKRKGHQERDKESEGRGWKRFRDVPPSFKSYSMTNKLPLSPAPSQCSTYSQLVAMVGWAAHSNRRRSGAVRLTVETVGIRLSVRLSVSVRQAGSRESKRPRLHRRGDASVCAGADLRLWPWVWGWSPHICWNPNTVRVGWSFLSDYYETVAWNAKVWLILTRWVIFDSTSSSFLKLSWSSWKLIPKVHPFKTQK